MGSRTIDWRIAPEEFVEALARLSRGLRRRAEPGPSGRRHVRDVVRRRRDWYMRLRGLAELPSLERQSALGDLWRLSDVTDLRIVVPSAPDPADPSIPRSRPVADARKLMRRLMHEAGDGLGRTALVTARAGRRRLPSIAIPRSMARQGELRALYLDRLGVAIMPGLTEAQVDALEEVGAMVVSNEFVVVGDPVDGRGLREGSGDASLPGSPPDHLRAIGLDVDDPRRPEGAGVLIGVLDSGIVPKHPEFAGKSIAYMAFGISGQRRRGGARDFGSHGTPVAALCAGRTVGVGPEADLAVAAVLTETLPGGSSGGHTAQILAGMNWLAGAGQLPRPVDLLNASFGGTTSAPVYRLPVATYRLGGTLLVAAIGNRGGLGFGHHSAPAMLDTALAVGAIDADGNVAGFSDWGDCHSEDGSATGCKADIVAPGVGSLSAVPGGGYERMNGTSMSCPIVTGAAALLIGEDERLRGDPDALGEAVLALATPPPAQASGHDPRRCGKGRLDLSPLEKRGEVSPSRSVGE